MSNVFLRTCVGTALFAAILALPPGIARAQSMKAPPSADTSDGAVFSALCFQCHGGGMWSDHRADRRGWEGVLYRMVGRGALWTEEDIRRMANYLSASFGPESAAPAAAKPARETKR